ncbi:hypothetical protein [Spirosoma validum]|uniref:Uncharacterized protein n=1 Tax=Spirosoma validum TaxID=2771355 RepID=A0A927GF24_9BACT|nr:hypothetical protein [Spirosoma validum]MBD2755261.1 hypothetical protein [Spirosoma validum]
MAQYRFGNQAPITLESDELVIAQLNVVIRNGDQGGGFQTLKRIAARFAHQQGGVVGDSILYCGESGCYFFPGLIAIIAPDKSPG